MSAAVQVEEASLPLDESKLGRVSFAVLDSLRHAADDLAQFAERCHGVAPTSQGDGGDNSAFFLAWLVYWCCIMTVDDEYQLFSFVLRFKARLARAPRQQPARWPARPTPSHALAPRLRSSRGSSGA